MTDFIRQFKRLGIADKLRLGGIIPFILLIKINLRLFGFKSVVRFLKRSVKDFSEENEQTEVIEQHHHLLILTHAIFKRDGMCLAISLAFWWLLQRERIKTDLRIGMKKSGAKLTAHAWLEHHEKPLTVDNRIGEKYLQFKDTRLLRMDEIG